MGSENAPLLEKRGWGVGKDCGDPKEIAKKVPEKTWQKMQAKKYKNTIKREE